MLKCANATFAENKIVLAVYADRLQQPLFLDAGGEAFNVTKVFTVSIFNLDGFDIDVFVFQYG
ncbi:hypothetical protein BA939_11455 [Rhizobium sp. S41]|nr:hypothetical protein BA939_11455 [Rhizobium sp. S41]